MAPKLTKAQQQKRIDATARLHTYLKPGSIVTTVLRHVSSSGMSRSISLMVAHDGDVVSLDYLAACALGLSVNGKHGGVKIGGCGMDMGFQIVYLLGQALWPDGTTEPHGKRNGEPDRDGGYALKQSWL